MMEIEEIKKCLNEIYSKVPEFKCENCGECCGPVVWSYPEDLVIREYLEKNNMEYVYWSQEQWIENKLKCPQLGDGSCKIYPVRPLVCRLQGHNKKLPCPKNPKPDMTLDESAKLMDEVKLLEMKILVVDRKEHLRFKMAKKGKGGFRNGRNVRK